MKLAGHFSSLEPDPVLSPLWVSVATPGKGVWIQTHSRPHEGEGEQRGGGQVGTPRAWELDPAADPCFTLLQLYHPRSPPLRHSVT